MKKAALLCALALAASCSDTGIKKRFKKELAESCIEAGNARSDENAVVCRCIADRLADKLSTDEMETLLAAVADEALQHKVTELTVRLVPGCLGAK